MSSTLFLTYYYTASRCGPAGTTFLAGTARALALILWYSVACAGLSGCPFVHFSRILLRADICVESKSGPVQTAIALPHPHGFGLKDAYKIQLAFDGVPPAKSPILPALANKTSGVGVKSPRRW